MYHKKYVFKQASPSLLFITIIISILKLVALDREFSLTTFFLLLGESS